MLFRASILVLKRLLDLTYAWLDPKVRYR